MVPPAWLILLLCGFMTISLFTLSCCVVIPSNWFRKHVKCMTPINKYYVTHTFCVLILVTHTIMAFPWLTSVINFLICTNFTNGCVSISGGGLFYFEVMPLSFSMRTLFTKHFVNRARWIPWVIINFGMWFAWRKLTPRILAAAIIWFQRFNAKA